MKPATSPALRVVSSLHDDLVPLDEIAPIASAALAAQQAQRAIDRMYEDPRECVAFPYASVHRMVGRIRPGRLVFVMAHTGQGKTTFLLDVLDRLVKEDTVCHYVGTEQQPDELWTKWACQRLGVPAQVAINLDWDAWHDPAARERVQSELEFLEMTYGARGLVRFVPDKFVTLDVVERAAAQARDEGATVLFVDHIDRIETGDAASDFRAMTALVRRLKELARDCDLVLLVASQVNRAARQGDRLGAYCAPQLQFMRGSGAKEEEADVVLGLWRPLRESRPGETTKELTEQVRLARAGGVAVADVISHDRMGVVLLKHRTASQEGRRTYLRLEHGRLSDMPERDQYQTAPCAAAD